VARRSSEHERILTYFRTTEIVAARMMLDLCTAEVRGREKGNPKAKQEPKEPKQKKDTGGTPHQKPERADLGHYEV
jgi:hypothetical protein